MVLLIVGFGDDDDDGVGDEGVGDEGVGFGRSAKRSGTNKEKVRSCNIKLKIPNTDSHQRIQLSSPHQLTSSGGR